jgi:hypothetical protein
MSSARKRSKLQKAQSTATRVQAHANFVQRLGDAISELAERVAKENRALAEQLTVEKERREFWEREAESHQALLASREKDVLALREFIGTQPVKTSVENGVYRLANVDELSAAMRLLSNTAPAAIAIEQRIRDDQFKAGLENWDGLARDIMQAFDMNNKTPRLLFQHLERCGTPIPQWMRDEPECKNLDHTISKGTRCVLIYRAMHAKPAA